MTWLKDYLDGKKNAKAAAANQKRIYELEDTIRKLKVKFSVHPIETVKRGTCSWWKTPWHYHTGTYIELVAGHYRAEVLELKNTKWVLECGMLDKPHEFPSFSEAREHFRELVIISLRQFVGTNIVERGDDY